MPTGHPNLQANTLPLRLTQGTSQMSLPGTFAYGGEVATLYVSRPRKNAHTEDFGTLAPTVPCLLLRASGESAPLLVLNGKPRERRAHHFHHTWTEILWQMQEGRGSGTPPARTLAASWTESGTGLRSLHAFSCL